MTNNKYDRLKREASAWGLTLPFRIKWYLETLKNIVILKHQAVHFSPGTAVHFSPGTYNRASRFKMHLLRGLIGYIGRMFWMHIYSQTYLK